MASIRMQCRILYLVGQLGKGGLERQLCYLLQAIDRERYKPVVVVWNDSGGSEYANQIRSLGVPLYIFSGKTSRHEKMRVLCRLAKTLTPEVIHSYSFHTNFAAWWSPCASQPFQSDPSATIS